MIFVTYVKRTQLIAHKTKHYFTEKLFLIVNIFYVKNRKRCIRHI